MGYFSVIFALSVVVLPSVLGWSALHLVSGEDIISRHESERGIEPDSSEYYFWNTITGEVQWDNPGGVPHETPNGMLYWVGKDGEHLSTDEEALQYTWVEGWSDEYERPFFYNQETQQSTWDRPPDLAWRRVRVQEEL